MTTQPRLYPSRSRPAWPGRLLAMGLCVHWACSERKEPPSSADHSQSKRVVAAELAGTAAGPSVPETSPSGVVQGTVDDTLPFLPTGERLGSTAWRTWVYTDTGPRRTRYGYLRVGSQVDARGPRITNAGCEQGWYRVNPRGFVCLGLGATLDLNAPILRQASVRPIRGQGLPYLYAMAGESSPHFYFQIPSRAQAAQLEGADPAARFLNWKLLKVDSVPAMAQLLGPVGPAPDFLLGAGRLNKPYGVERRLEEGVNAGRSAPDSGFALSRVMAAEGRWYAMTTEHDLIAMDRLRVVLPSSLQGVEIPVGASLPVGIVDREQLARFTADAQGNMGPSGAYGKRQGLVLTGQRKGPMWETGDGQWVAGEGLRFIPPRKDYPSFATGDRKWIDISIQRQTLVAYVGKQPVYATLVSTGRGGMGDPETQSATIRGTFMIYAKHVSATMDGSEDVSDSYSLLDVPFVQYFHKGFALHGTYWHDEFGRVRSHGCVNLAPRDAAWLFEWTDPVVPEGWHGVINKERGTVVYIHG